MMEWRALSARIAAIFASAKFLNLGTLDPIYWDGNRTAAGTAIFENAKSTVESLEKLRDTALLPAQPRDCLNKLLAAWKESNGPHGKRVENGLLPALTLLASFRAEFEYLISDHETVTKSLARRAFTHLQSSLAADPEVRKKWTDAFERGEIACESLGACHLLLHGIWSFKANSSGARTDLVLGEPQENWDEARRAAQGLILTEWKRVASPEELEKRAEEAMRQAKIYSAEPLAGFEVASTRYLVLVSKKRLEPLPPIIQGTVTYEYRNIAVDPETPSINARKGATNMPA